MTNPITNYFSDEKRESILFIGLGFLSCAIAVFYLLIKQEPYYNGLAYAFVSIGLVKLVVGMTIFFRSDMDTVRVNHYVEREPKSLVDYEIPRMELVLKNLVIYRWVEGSLIILGLLLFFACESKTLGRGLGLGVFIESVVMLVLDYLAEKRGKAYMKYIQSVLRADTLKNNLE